MICSKCKVDRPEEEFAFKNKSKNIRQVHCKHCKREYAKKHYIDNKDSYKKRSRVNNKSYASRNRDFLNELKDSLQCIRCGQNHIATLDFHHTNPDEKEFSITRAISNSYSIDKIKNEISKCIVLCSNCHRIHHWNERQNN